MAYRQFFSEHILANKQTDMLAYHCFRGKEHIYCTKILIQNRMIIPLREKIRKKTIFPLYKEKMITFFAHQSLLDQCCILQKLIYLSIRHSFYLSIYVSIKSLSIYLSNTMYLILYLSN